MLTEDLYVESAEFLSETIGYAVLDTGCNTTVCGQIWLQTFIDSLSNGNARRIRHLTKREKFRFGDGPVFESVDCVEIPVFIGNKSLTLTTQVVTCNIPLLLSRTSMKKAEGHIDLKQDKVTLFGEKIPLKISKSGHYCIALYQNFQQSLNSLRNHVQNVMFTIPHCQTAMFSSNMFSSDNDTCYRQIRKLHRQFAHPKPDKLKKLLCEAGIDDGSVLGMVEKVSNECDVCKRFKRPPHRPIVSFPLANDFNETVAIDIKVVYGKLVLHMIDHLTRYSSACVIANKRKETIVQGIMEYWVRIFGPPGCFLTDNGGEFANDELVEYSEQFNIKLITTAAESAWSNGLCERHNASLANNIMKTIDDTKCDFVMAVHWSIAAKNSLSNVYGFSPNQLVFGRNPNFPCTLNNKIPAQNTCHSRYISMNLAALHKARETFIQQESCERLQRALRHQTRTYADVVFRIGNNVYYKRENAHEWHGPARIIGKDNQQYLLKHGGTYHRVHACKLQHADVINNDNNSNDVSTQTLSSASSHLLSREEISSTPRLSELSSTPRLSDHSPGSLLPTETRDMEDDSDSEDDQLKNNDLTDEIEEPPEPNIMTPAPAPEPNFRTPAPAPEPRALVRLRNHNKPGLTEHVLHATSTTSPRFDEAKRQELQKWIEMDTYTEVQDEGQSYITTRWVCTEKIKDNEIVLKARLVARGFEENTNELRKDSPTCQKESLRCFLSILSSMKWKIHSIDIKSAYLQGIPINRELYIKPPNEAQTDKLWLLKKCPYGLADAGRHWYMRVKEELKKLGGKQMSLDQSVFVWNKENCIIGIMVIHVDDFIFGGTDIFQDRVITGFREIFKIGREESSNYLKYIGIILNQKPEGIYLSTNTYCQDLTEIDTINMGSDSSRKLHPNEVKLLKQAAGQINWATNQSRPDCSFDNCTVANSTKEATVADINRANKILRKLRGQPVDIFFPTDLNLSSCRIVVFSDASHANLPDRGSQGAHVIFLCDENGHYSLLAWQSRRIKRVVNSTLAAECLAAVEASDAAIALNHLLCSMLGRSPLPLSVFSDNKSLVDNVHSTTAVDNKRLQIDIGILREDLLQNNINEFRWIETGLNVANSLTKNGCSSTYLFDILRLRKKFDFNTGAFI